LKNLRVMTTKNLRVMTTRKTEERNIRSLTKVSGGTSYAVT
jgi:hypothetical protein